MAIKEKLILDLLQKMGANEIKFTIRFLLKRMKIGASESSVEQALARSLCRNYFTHKKWYDSQSLNFCESLLKIDNTASASKENRIQKVLTDYRNLAKDERIRFTRVYFEEMINFSSKSASPKTSKGKTKKQNEADWELKLKMMLSQYPHHENVIDSIMLFGQPDTVLSSCSLTPGVPCKPMLAKPTKAISQIFARFEGKTFTCELKYDGLRGQIHYFDDANGDKKIKIFSRNLEDMTEKYFDLVTPLETLAKKSNLDSFILDTEIMAYDVARDRILPFQVLSTRKRKVTAEMKQANHISTQVCLFVFDILYFQSENLLLNTFQSRRDKMALLDLSDNDKTIKLAEHKDLDSIEAIQEYLDESIKKGCEGLMIKTLEEDSAYKPSKRTYKWLKLKKDYLENNGLGDSFDLVIIGANMGKGKRTGKFGTFLVASYNDTMDTYETCCHVGTGFSDKLLGELYEHFKDKVRIDIFT